MSALRNALSILLFVMAVLYGSTVMSSDPQYRVDLEQNFLKWNSQQFVNYGFTIQRLCECPPLMTTKAYIQVREGKIVDARYEEAIEWTRWSLKEGEQSISLPKGAPVDSDVADFIVKTIPELFGLIDEAISKDPFDLQITYHDKYGYPTNVWIDQDFYMADEELVFEVDLRFGEK